MGSVGWLVVSVVLAVLAGGWIGLGQLAAPPLLRWAAAAALGYTVAGWALQRKARPAVGTYGAGARDFAVFAGVLVGTVGAALVSGLAVLIGLLALAAMTAYARLPERYGPLGDLALAALTGLPLAFGASAVAHPAGGIIPSILAAWIYLLRAMVADLETEPLDRTRGRRTVAVRLGRSRATMLAAIVALAFIPASLILPARGGYGMAYFLLAIFAQLAVLVTAARLIVGRTDRVSALLTGAMVVGAVALVAGRVT